MDVNKERKKRETKSSQRALTVLEQKYNKIGNNYESVCFQRE